MSAIQAKLVAQMSASTKHMTPSTIAAVEASSRTIATNALRVAKLKPQPVAEVDDEEAVRLRRQPGEELSDIGEESSDQADERDESDGEAANGAEEDAEAPAEAYDGDAAEDDPDPDDGEGDDKKPRKQRARRVAPDAPARAQNIRALKNLSASENFKKEALSPLAESAAAVAAIDFYNGRRSSGSTDNLWGALVGLTAANHSAPLAAANCGLPERFAFPTLAANIVQLRSALVRLVQYAMAVDEEARAFRDTFLAGAVSVAAAPAAKPASGDGAVQCQMVRALVPANTTVSIEIAYADPATSKQTIVVASKFLLLIEALLFVDRLPEAIYAAVEARLMNKTKAKEAAGKKKHVAITLALSDSSAQGIREAALHAINKAITHLRTAPNKFNDVRKTTVRAGGAPADESAAMHLDFQ